LRLPENAVSITVIRKTYKIIVEKSEGVSLEDIIKNILNRMRVMKTNLMHYLPSV